MMSQNGKTDDNAQGLTLRDDIEKLYVKRKEELRGLPPSLGIVWMF